MSTSLEVSQAFGPDEPKGYPFNDYDIVNGKNQRIARITLFESEGKVVGIKVAYNTTGSKTHGSTKGKYTDIDISSHDNHVIAAFVAVEKSSSNITSVYFNVSDINNIEENPVTRMGMAAPDPTTHTIHATFGNIIALHGTTNGTMHTGSDGDETLESLGFQVLTTR